MYLEEAMAEARKNPDRGFKRSDWVADYYFFDNNMIYYRHNGTAIVSDTFVRIDNHEINRNDWITFDINPGNNFDWAMKELDKGNKVTRKAWPKGTYVMIRNNIISGPTLLTYHSSGYIEPIKACLILEDIKALDWILFKS